FSRDWSSDVCSSDLCDPSQDLLPELVNVRGGAKLPAHQEIPRSAHPARRCESGAGHRPRRRNAEPQCAKWRVPVKYIGTPASSQARTVSSSRTEPPGCTIARTPASNSTFGPSANGKKASEAATDPLTRSPARETANRAESTRFTWPIPTPTVAPSLASRIALDLTARHARHANTRSARVCSSTGDPVASVQLAGSSPSASIASMP